ncbi:uncharacterized protein I303_104825 [Kwoniella dejecticola CBS 10117]|uniref:Uncharacterized protein n=1 Tax=Kwoniella dejecticola CBS 10117 TaxID=1296121 RepID=A0A1A6A4A0_9TREE|nr:uncharacterized protein I303_04194 [Kwoniella dejecticola CBS 10117]OBR84873.1 hypothetical protein I303_04194 [Kwoniella dejecticola CBS 10117]
MTNNHAPRHKRSQAKGLISIPTPTSSSTFMIDQPYQHQHQHRDEETRPRFSGESLTPNDGYSGLFTSGLLPNCVPTPSPTLSSFPSPPRPDTQPSPPKPYLAPPYYGNVGGSGPGLGSGLGLGTPTRRRRSSIIHTTPGSVSPKKLKSAGTDNGVERALDNVMRNLRVTMSMTTTPKKNSCSYNGPQSRWSSSTEGSTLESHHEDEESGSGGLFGKPRKSSETTRSKLTIRSTKSSKKGRKSEDTQRGMDIDCDDGRPQVPPIPQIPTTISIPIPSTPGRSRRMMNGLVKRLGLTPKKSKQSLPPSLPANQFSEREVPPSIPELPLALPPPLPIEIEDRVIAKKGSFSTLRSAITKKSSNTTLKSFKSASHPHHPFATCTYGEEEAPPIPSGLPKARYHDKEIDAEMPDYFPSTPRSRAIGRRTPKSSIGPPRLQPDLSPSKFLNQLPRKAPETPKRDAFDIDRNMLATHQTPPPASDRLGGVIRFEEEELGDIVMCPDTCPTSPNQSTELPDLEGDTSVDRSQEIFTPISVSKKHDAKPTQAQLVIQQTMNSLTRGQNGLASPFRSGVLSTPTTPSLDHTVFAKATKSKPVLLNLDPVKKKMVHPGLASPAQIQSQSRSQGESQRTLRSKKSKDRLAIGPGGPLSMKNVNSLGLPVPTSASEHAGNKSKTSRKDPLGIINRFRSSSKVNIDSEYADMPFRGGAGDGWSTPLPLPLPLAGPYAGIGSVAFPEPRPSGSGDLPRPRKLNLGTVESYFDENLNTFRAASANRNESGFGITTGLSTRTPLNVSQTRGVLPDFSAPPPPTSNHTSFNSNMEQSKRASGDRMEDVRDRFGDEFDNIEQSPEYFFQLERPVQDDFDIDIDSDGEDENEGNIYRDREDKTLKKMRMSGHTIHTMTTGEGAEEWELEKYLRDWESDHAQEAV